MDKIPTTVLGHGILFRGGEYLSVAAFIISWQWISSGHGMVAMGKEVQYFDSCFWLLRAIFDSFFSWQRLD